MVQVDYLILADSATVAEGKHYIHGAGWDSIGAVTFPVIQPMLTVAVLLRIPWNDTNQPHMLELDVVNADGASILRTPPGPPRGPIIAGRPPQLPVGGDVLAPLVFNLVGVQFERPSTYAVVMRIDGLELKRFPFHLISLIPPALPPAVSAQP